MSARTRFSKRVDIMTNQVFRDVVLANMPFRTGNMFLRGCKFYETDEYFLASYDLVAVQYIIYNETGTKYTQKNKGFISQKTVGELAAVDALNLQTVSGFSDNAKRRALDIVCDKI